MLPLESLHRNPLPLIIVLTGRRSRRWLKRQVVLTNLAVMLGLASGLLVTHAIAPLAVHAYTGTVNVTIDVQPSETYDTLVRRAEAIARAATQRSFDRDILVTDVAIVVIAENAVSTVPVLSLATTRSQWRSQPDPRRWATYYSTAKALLGLNKAPSVAATTVQPTVTSTPTAPTAPTTSSQPRSTTPKTPTAPTTAPGGAITGSPQPATTTPGAILPSRIPTPGNIGK
ncbi:MAG: hypothetical protein KME42_18360 [Tildeniella nuda ZEHNDER 1965/U140]|jgi:hypothetical protein|nr:hypothetical protein [Tildeniella nuda ZEHNDER 1965/U140]